MHYAFQDKENLYLVMDYLSGGELRDHLSACDSFSEALTKFFVGCLVLGLEYIHAHKIIHRDIKPENIVMDKHGYIRITDFGIARAWREDNAKDTSGTPGYMAPEVLRREKHSYAVDYFALGVIAHELMLGCRPFTGRNRDEIRQCIEAKRVNI